MRVTTSPQHFENGGFKGGFEHANEKGMNNDDLVRSNGATNELRATSVDSSEDSLSTSSFSPNSNSNSMSIPSINLPDQEPETRPRMERMNQLNETLNEARALLRGSTQAAQGLPPSCSSPFVRKLSQIGGPRSLVEDPMCPEIRRRDELMRSTERLRGSMASLSTNDGVGPGRESGRNTPVAGVERFHARSAQYRSFNAKRPSEKQEQILESLAKLREQLRTRQNAKPGLGSRDAALGRSISTSFGSNIGLTRSPTTPCMPSSPLATPGTN